MTLLIQFEANFNSESETQPHYFLIYDSLASRLFPPTEYPLAKRKMGTQIKTGGGVQLLSKWMKHNVVTTCQTSLVFLMWQHYNVKLV